MPIGPAAAYLGHTYGRPAPSAPYEKKAPKPESLTKSVLKGVFGRKARPQRGYVPIVNEGLPRGWRPVADSRFPRGGAIVSPSGRMFYAAAPRYPAAAFARRPVAITKPKKSRGQVAKELWVDFWGTKA